jgi:hypothetical protein
MDDRDLEPGPLPLWLCLLAILSVSALAYGLLFWAVSELTRLF